MNFEKSHALGNDYLVLDPSERSECLSENEIVRICHRNFGLGSDGILWGPFRTYEQMIEEDPFVSTDNPLFEEIDQPGIGRLLTPGSPLDFTASPRTEVARGPLLGEHSDEILSTILGMGEGEIGRLHDGGIIAGPEAA